MIDEVCGCKKHVTGNCFGTHFWDREWPALEMMGYIDYGIVK